MGLISRELVMKIWIKDPLTVFVGEHEQPPKRGILIEDGVISELLDTVPDQFDASMDASNLVVLPGLINTHHHFYQTLTRSVRSAINRPLFPWLEALYPIWAHLKEDDVRLSTELAAVELLLSGCTTAVDHHYIVSPQIPDPFSIQVETAQSTGIRAVICRGSMSLSQKDGGLPPDSVVQSDDDVLQESEAFIRKWHDPKPGAMTQVALAPCSPFSVSKQLMLDTANLARREQVLLHTHLAETEDENTFCVARYGQRPLDYLEEVDWLRSTTWLAHGIHFNRAEIERLGRAGLGVSHCPTSNMILGSGLCPASDLENAGVRIGLGVDGSASADSSNMMQEVRQALLLQRLHAPPEAITPERALTWGTKGGAALIQRNDIGAIAIGRQADLAFFSLDELRFSGAEDPLSALVLSGAYRAKHVMVAGDWLVSDYQLTRLDEHALRNAHDEAAKGLLSRALS